MIKILMKMTFLFFVTTCSTQDLPSHRKVNQESENFGSLDGSTLGNDSQISGSQEQNAGFVDGLPKFSISWRPVVPADFYKLEFLLPSSFASKCSATGTATFVFELFEKGDLVFSSSLALSVGSTLPSFTVDPIFLESNDFHLVKIKTQKSSCLPEKLQLYRSQSVQYQRPDQGHNWQVSSVKDFDNTAITLRSANSKLPVKWSVQNKKDWNLYFFNPISIDGEPLLSSVSPTGRSIQIDQRNSNRRWIFIEKLTSNLVGKFLVNPGTSTRSVSRVGSIGLVPAPIFMTVNTPVAQAPQYILKSFRYSSSTMSTDPLVQAAGNSKAIQKLVDDCQIMSHGCTIAIEGRVITDKPIFVSSGTHITGLSNESQVFSRNPSIGFNGTVFSFGLVTRFSFSRLYANDRYFNKNGDAISEVQANSRYLSINVNPVNATSPLLDESYKVGSQIMIVDRFHPGCLDIQNCVNGIANWFSYLGTIPQSKLFGVMINPPQALSLNVIESISPDRRLITLRYPVLSKIVQPLLVNYSGDTYVNPSNIPGSTQKQFFSKNSSISDLTISSTFAPALVQGCLNCLFQNIEMGTEGLVPRSMIYGNAAVRTMYSDIRGKFSRHSIELAIGSEKSTIKRVNVNQVECTEQDCSLVYTPNGGTERECLPMSIGLTERATAISMENIKVTGFSGLKECILTAIALTGNDHKISDVTLIADQSRNALEIRESEGGIVMNRIAVDAGENLETAYGLLESAKKVSIVDFSILHSSTKNLRKVDKGTLNKIERMKITYEPSTTQ